MQRETSPKLHRESDGLPSVGTSQYFHALKLIVDVGVDTGAPAGTESSRLSISSRLESYAENIRSHRMASLVSSDRKSMRSLGLATFEIVRRL